MQKRRTKLDKREDALVISLARGALMENGQTYLGRETADELLARLTPHVAKDIRNKARELAMKPSPAIDPWNQTPTTAIT